MKCVFEGSGPIVLRRLPDHLRRPPEQPVESAGQRLVLGDSILDGLLRRRWLIAKIHQRGKHIVRGPVVAFVPERSLQEERLYVSNHRKAGLQDYATGMIRLNACGAVK